MYGGGHLSLRDSMKGHGGRVTLMGTPKDMLSKVLKMGICFHSGPAFGEHGEALFHRAFQR